MCFLLTMSSVRTLINLKDISKETSFQDQFNEKV